jgi:phosphate-selective porin OprO/OprP
MKHLAVLLFGVFFLLGPDIVLAQTEGTYGDRKHDPTTLEPRLGTKIYQSADEMFKVWVDSRLQIDAAMYFENKNPLSNGTIMRRATFALKSVLWKDWQMEIDMDFAENALDARDMWIRYNFRKVNTSLTVGNFKEPFGLERLGSSRLLTFMERAMVSNAFPLGRRMGLAARYWTSYGQLTLGVFGHEIGTRVDKGTLDEGFSTNIRISVAPINERGKTLHIGAAASYKTPDVVADLATNTIELKARTETYVFDPKPLHTGDIADVNYFTRLGGELGGVFGPFYFQAELQATQVKRWYGKPTGNFLGGYGTISYLLTGESREYFTDEGEFGEIDDIKGGWGALEVAARYSVLNLNDAAAAIMGGKGNQLMLGLNWYPNNNLKIQFNYSAVILDDYATSKGRMIGGDNFSFIQTRFQAVL